MENTKALELQIEFLKSEKEALEKETAVTDKQIHLVAENNTGKSNLCLKVQLFDKEYAEARSKAEDLKETLCLSGLRLRSYERG